MGQEGLYTYWVCATKRPAVTGKEAHADTNSPR